MSIRSFCAAAAVVMGTGWAADAATVDRVTITLSPQFICEDLWCDDDAPAVDDFYGIPVSVAVTGWLSIGDQDGSLLRHITFAANGVTRDLGRFQDDAGGYLNDDLISSFIVFRIRWDGASGSIWYRDDGAPWSLDIQGTIAPAPVPLPATAALLPLGIGALAMMRRRRRPAQAGSIAPRDGRAGRTLPRMSS